MSDAVKDALFVWSALSFLVPEWNGGEIMVLEDNEGTKTLAERALRSFSI